ncbi:uncharacterized protein LOC119992556 isoform X1 [Tripterygium wilfordii]|nr:uncharacterized protein LOC119992556 isoform X1 [Tripterygium wilfordii]XP_038695233.1 uncharacterized protein LOC119992556 isoform X1 [Tripterygium wilfordii]XP_038695234.1 uncharacterized protein LOC119992556 isoform X1 [Tripterygium wilfordii]
MNQKVYMRVESGFCNLCSAPCSSCMHLNPARMGSKSDGSSEETCHATVTSQISVSAGDILSSKSRACETLQHATSEGSTLLSVNSSHDSLSENAESKVIIRLSDVSDASNGTEVLPNSSLCGTGADGRPSSKAPPVLDESTSKLKEKFREVENRDDNTSFISGVNDADVLVSYSKESLERKIVSCDTAYVSNLDSKGSGKALISCNSGMLETWSVDASAHGGIPKGKVPVGPGECINLSSSKEAATGANSVVSNKNSEVEMDKDSKQPPEEGHKISDKVDQDEKNIKSAGLSDAKEHPLQSVSADESDESDIVEHDVKICDICGDAGREDLLAICSKCSDGAEHTYCMGEMIKKVPEGDWLCEECKFAEESESQKQDAEVKRVNKASPSIPNSGNKHAENMEVASPSRRQAIEPNTVSPKSSSPPNTVSPKSSSPHRTATLPQDSSFNLDKGKAKPTQKSFGNQSGNDILETVRSPTTSMRLHPPKGTLLKSYSFSTPNFKPKLKQVDEVFYRQKETKEHAASDIKDGHTRTIGKSASFKSVIPGRLNAPESKVKMLSSQFSLAKDLKGLRPTKDRNAPEWKKSLKQDRPLVTSSAVSSSISSPKADSKLTSASNNRDSKSVQSDGKLSTLTKSAGGLARKALETPVTSVGASDASGNSGSGGQKMNQVIPKDETASNASWTADRPSSNSCVLDGLPRSGELLQQGEKSRELPVSHSRHPVTMASRNFPCRKCKETGHASEFCAVSSPLSSGVDLSVSRSLKEEMRKGPKLKDAVEFAMLKRPRIHKKKGEVEEMDGLSTPKTSVKSERASEEQHYAHCPTVSAFCKTFSIPVPEYSWQGTFEVQKGGGVLDLSGSLQAHLSTCASPKVLEVVKKLPLKVALDEVPRLSTWPTQFQCNGVSEDNIALYFFAKDLESYEKSYMGLLDNMIKSDLALKGTVDGVELLIFPSNVLPENCQRWNMLFFLWGVFRGRRSICSVSSSYSDPSKKLGVFDSNAATTLKEISNAITSFSENICSDTFTGKKNSPACESSCDAVQEYDATDKTHVTMNGDSDKEVCLMEDRVLDLEASCKQEEGELESKSSSNTASGMGSLCPKMEPNNPLEDQGQHIKLKKPSVLEIGIKGSSDKSEKTQSNALLVKEDSSAFKQLPIQNGEKGIAGHIGKVEVADRMLIDGDGIKLEKNLGRDDRDINIETCSAGHSTIEGLNSKHRKRPHLDLSKPAPESSNDTDQTLPWNELDADGESVNKKLKADYSEVYECSRTNDVFASQMHDAYSGCSIEDKRSEDSCDEKVILEDLGSAERYFFPVVTPHVKGFQLEDKPLPWKRPSSEDQNRSHDRVPDLELALGADRKPPNKGLLPFFVGMGDRNNTQNRPFDKMTDTGEEDDPAASLSLSLSFPFKDNEHAVKSVTKTEQVLPERHNVSTSLLLFGGLLDK